MRTIRTATIGLTLMAALGAGVLATPARADWHHHWNHHWHHWYHPWVPRAVVVAPRPYYYAPPPAYYTPPPPVVYAPPAYYTPGLSFGVNIR
jgi:hypothetical protein